MNLVATDRVPAGKRTLREKIAELQKDIHDGIDVRKENDTLPALRKTERLKTKG